MADTATQEAPQAQDPLDVATEMIYKVLVGLTDTVTDFKKMEQTKVMLDVAKTIALIDIAKSLRVTNQLQTAEVEKRNEV